MAFNSIQMTDEEILVAIKRRWLTHGEQQARQLERAMQACQDRDVWLDEDGIAQLTLDQWRRFKAGMVLQKAVDEVLSGG